MNEYPFRARLAFAIWTKVINPCIPGNTMHQVKPGWTVHCTTVSIYTVVWARWEIISDRGGGVGWPPAVSACFIGLLDGWGTTSEMTLCVEATDLQSGTMYSIWAKSGIDPYSNFNILWFQRNSMSIAEQFWCFVRKERYNCLVTQIACFKKNKKTGDVQL